MSDDTDSGGKPVDTSGDGTGTPRKFVPRRPPMMVPGLEDLKQSKLFKQDKHTTDNDTPPSTATATSSTNRAPPLSILGQRRSSEGMASGYVTSESGAGHGGKSLYKKPVWLSEMKAKASNAKPPDPKPEDQGSESVNADFPSSASSSSSSPKVARRRVSELSQLDSPSSARNGSVFPAKDSENDVMSDLVDESTPNRGVVGFGLKRRGVIPGSGGTGERKEWEKEAERPSWMKKAQEKTSRVADSLQGKTENQNNRQTEGDDDTQVKPPWAVELKRRNRPLVGYGLSVSTGDIRSGEGAETPAKKSMEQEDAEREIYTPSWVDQSQLNSSNTTTPRISGKVKATTNGSTPDVRGPQGIPAATGEIPSWKLELVEKKRRRQSLQTGSAEAGSSSSSSSSGSGAKGDVTDSASSSLASLRQQLKPRKSSTPNTSEKPTPSGQGGGESASPDWAKQVEERRARLLKSGLLGGTSDESQC